MEPLVVGIGAGAGTAAIAYFRETAGRSGEVEVAQTHSFRRSVRPALCFDRGSRRWYVGDAAWLKGRQADNVGHYLSSPAPWLSWSGALAVGTADTVIDGDGVRALSSPWLLGQLLQALIDGLVKQAEDDFRIEEVALAAPLARVDDWRPALEQACALSGVRLAAVVAEPLCILTTYLCEARESLPSVGEQVLLLNWGAETLQLSTVRRLASDVPAGFKVVAAASAPVGGNAVDGRILDFLRRQAGDGPTIRLPAGPARAALWQRIEEAKISLSNAAEDEAVGDPAYPELVDVPSADGPRGVALGVEALVALLEEPEPSSHPDISSTLRALCAGVLDQGGPVQRVFLAGGSARLPVCRSVIRSVFGADVRFPRLPSECPLDAVVVRGATWQAAARRGKAVLAPHLDATRLLCCDVDVRLETGSAVQTAHVFEAGTPLHPSSPLARTVHLHTSVGGPAAVRCIGRWRDLPYERLTASVRRIAALGLGPLPAGTGVAVEVQVEAPGSVSLTAFGPGWRIGSVRGTV